KGGVSYQTHIQMELNYYKTKIQEAKSENVKAKYEKLLKQREASFPDSIWPLWDHHTCRSSAALFDTALR
ncbi:MAG: hypothetical protein PHW61_08090, partial [Eubacteriales bacterium]|nr:hypothetical protein [Eubacteriales bacterium]